MKRSDRIKLDFTRNWKLPGKERFSRWFKPSDELKTSVNDGIAWLNDEDIAIYANANNYIEWTVLSNGAYEAEINKLIRVSLKAGRNALDIGANIGLQSIRMAQCVGNNGKVLAFEPLNYLQEKFLRNLSLNRVNNVTLLPFALAETAYEAEFPIEKNSWNQGTFSLTGRHSSDEQQKVTVRIGDNVPEIQELESLDFVKIDVEGFEFQVMLGLKDTIKRHAPRIIFEYDDNYWTKTGQNIAECYALLSSFGYTFYQITPVGCELIRNEDNISGGNLFCIRS